MAKAEADAAQVSRASTSRVASEGTAILDDKQLGRHLDILPEDGIMTSVPKAVSLFFPAAHNGECRALAPAPSGSTFASCGADMIVHLWNAAGATKLGSLRVRDKNKTIRAFWSSIQYLIRQVLNTTKRKVHGVWKRRPALVA